MVIHINKCLHKSCGREERVWYLTDTNSYSDVEQHPWCVHCGIIKNITDDRPHKIGYWMGKLGAIANYCSIKQVNKRSIAKEIEKNEIFDDTYGTTGSTQKTIFKKTIRKYCTINPKIIDSFFN